MRWEELLEENKNLNALIQNVPGGVFCCDADPETGLLLLEYNDGFLKLLGYTKEEIKDKFQNQFRKLICEADWEETMRSANAQKEKSSLKTLEYRVKCAGGELKRVRDHGQLVKRSGRDVYYCILTDVTKEREMTEELRMSLERHQIILAQTRDIIFEWDVEADTVQWSDHWKKRFGYEPFEKHVKEGLLQTKNIYPEDRAVMLDMFQRLLENTSYMEREIRIRDNRNQYIWCRVRASLQVAPEQRRKKVIGVVMDIDAEKKKAEKLKERAEKDALTGIYNKGTVQLLANEYFTAMEPGEMAGCFMIDIDDFKQINDVYGHLSGDVVLQKTAEGIQKVFRKNDIVGRIGGDEFIVIMKGIQEQSVLKEKAEEVLSVFQQLLEKKEQACSGSIGISVLPNHGITFEEAYKKADLALYKAKASGKNIWKMYEDGDQMETMRAKLPDKEDRSLEEAVQYQRSGVISYVFETLYHSADVEHTIRNLLQKTGTWFGMSRAYIFEYVEESQCGYYTFEWCKEGAERELLYRADKAVLETYYKNFDDGDMFYCRDTALLEEPLGRMMQEQKVKSFVQCLMKDTGLIRGFTGFDACESSRLWTKEQLHTLQAVSEIFAVFLSKERISIQARRKKEQQEEAGQQL